MFLTLKTLFQWQDSTMTYAKLSLATNVNGFLFFSINSDSCFSAKSNVSVINAFNGLLLTAFFTASETDIVATNPPKKPKINQQIGNKQISK